MLYSAICDYYANYKDSKNASKWLAFPFRIERGNNLKVVNVTASGCTVPSSWGFRMPCHNII